MPMSKRLSRTAREDRVIDIGTTHGYKEFAEF
jgi:hypothetical protein